MKTVFVIMFKVDFLPEEVDRHVHREVLGHLPQIHKVADIHGGLESRTPIDVCLLLILVLDSNDQ